MASYQDGSGAPRGLDPAARSARREAQRRALRRRRILALALVAGAVIAVAAAVAIAAGGSGGGSPAHGSASGGASASGGTSNGSASGSSQAAHAGSTAAGLESGHAAAAAVPVLMYHVIAAPPAGAPFPGLYVSPEEFSAQMRALKAAGWHAVTMDQLAANWNRGASLGQGRPIVLTFDNGYHSQYTQAMPTLRSLGWVGVENIQISGLPPSQGGLDEAEVKGLLAAGWELDTQGYDHADLVRLGPEALRFQVATTRKTLQQRYHVPVNWFCYPSGHYDDTVVAAVREAGYEGSTTVVPGWVRSGEDRYRLHRLRVLGGTSPQALLELIASSRTNPPAPNSYTGA